MSYSFQNLPCEASAIRLLYWFELMSRDSGVGLLLATYKLKIVCVIPFTILFAILYCISKNLIKFWACKIASTLRNSFILGWILNLKKKNLPLDRSTHRLCLRACQNLKILGSCQSCLSRAQWHCRLGAPRKARWLVLSRFQWWSSLWLVAKLNLWKKGFQFVVRVNTYCWSLCAKISLTDVSQ